MPAPPTTKLSTSATPSWATAERDAGQRLEVRPSRSRPDQGLIKVRTTTLNQNDEAVQVIIANLVVPRRPPQDGKERADIGEATSAQWD
jgi:hypothetical protein